MHTYFVTDDSSYKDKLTLTITEGNWQYTDTLSAITHSLILHHFDVSISCDPQTTTMPSLKLIRGPVITRGNKDTFPANMGTLSLQDCNSNVLEAYCSYPTGKGNGECVCVCVCVHVRMRVCICTLCVSVCAYRILPVNNRSSNNRCPQIVAM